MPLPWVRLDTQWPHNPKFLMLAEDKKWRAGCVYMGALAYSGAHGLDGFMPTAALPTVHGTKTQAADLVAVGLWTPTEGGWLINGWQEFQITNAEYEARRKKSQNAALSRWYGKHAPSNAPSID